MIVLSNSTAQTILPGSSITFDVEQLHSGCGECHRKNSSAVILRATGGSYEIQFHGNIGGPVAATEVQLSINAGGEPLPETVMRSTPTTANTEFNNVGAATALKNCCSATERITVTNTGIYTVLVAPGSALFIKRVS